MLILGAHYALQNHNIIPSKYLQLIEQDQQFIFASDLVAGEAVKGIQDKMR